VNPAFIIARKRDDHALSQEEIGFFVRGFADGSIPDYQMSALAMAIFLRGMSTVETSELTRWMLASGVTLDWPADGVPRVDKHSTGGIGDKVSLILAPLLAGAGLRVPMISGRGLGATGGTLDKLEAIAGFRTDLSIDEMKSVVADVGCVITGASSELAPADKRLYALRDVTGTVPSIPLITGSIMSKKLAEGLDALVLDVKYGTGAFMKDIDQARQLARSLVDVGRAMGLKVSALLTDMNQPLGRMVGNAVEVNESVKTLAGEGPADLTEVTLALGGELLRLTERVESRHQGAERLRMALHDGTALTIYRRMISAQGGDVDAPLELATGSVVNSTEAGYLPAVDAERLGQAIITMGGGRRVMTDQIDHAVGLEMLVRIGDRVEFGQPLAQLFARDATRETAASMIQDACRLQDDAVTAPILIAETVT